MVSMRCDAGRHLKCGATLVDTDLKYGATLDGTGLSHGLPLQCAVKFSRGASRRRPVQQLPSKRPTVDQMQRYLGDRVVDMSGCFVIRMINDSAFSIAHHPPEAATIVPVWYQKALISLPLRLLETPALRVASFVSLIVVTRYLLPLNEVFSSLLVFL
jgi:hypothetical protein